MPSMATKPFDALRWHRLTAELEQTRGGTRVREHPLAVVNSIVKNVCERTGLPFPHKTVFHVRGKGREFKFVRSVPFTVDIVFFQQETLDVRRWREDLLEYLAHANRNFAVRALGEPEERGYAAVLADLQIDPVPGELCLEFLAPLHFKREPGRAHSFISTANFIRLLESRYERLFDAGFGFTGDPSRFEVLPYFWKFFQAGHVSKSQSVSDENAPSVEYIKGYCGKLYLKGDLSGIFPYLVLGSEVHAGTQLAYARGYYRLHGRPVPHFCRKLFRPGPWQGAVQNLLEENDAAFEYFAEREGDDFQPAAFAGKLLERVRTGEYRPAPNQAFPIPKKDGSSRLVEKLSFEDLAVHKVLLKCLQEEFDAVFEESSLGFRKMKNVQNAVSRIDQAIRDGFVHVFESDVEDFFPSVDLDRLTGLLTRYLPEADAPVLRLLERLLRAGHALPGGGAPAEPRRKGLAMGSPLSPLLANLYLDSFDESFLRDRVRMARYGDDFVVLAKTAGDAQASARESGEILAGLGLGLKETKTRLVHVSEGFDFLGYRFDSAGCRREREREPVRLLRKPLYIVEPYAFLSLNGEAVEVRKNQKPLGLVPLRRVSEILALERVSLSSSLVRYCAGENIPITLALDSAYYITTITPAGKEDYALAHEHAKKFFSLSEAEKLLLAKKIVDAKLNNYQTLFRQKYRPGTAGFLEELDRIRGKTAEADTLDQVRGHEGQAAKRIFAQLNLSIDDPAFKIVKRDRKRPDPVNSVMNLTYSLLFSRLNSLLRAAGLNPYLGVLHGHENRYESLTCDLMEYFRARMDRFILRSIAQKSVQEADFHLVEGRLFFLPGKKRHYLELFEKELEAGRSKTSLSLKDQMTVVVRRLKRWVEGQGEFPDYQWKR